MQVDTEFIKELKKADLRYVSDSRQGITRKHQGDAFIYYDPQNNRISNEQVLDRIKKLSIPPAWTDVWICASPSGYLQATGYDDKNRKQYIYHEEWTKLSQENKFSRIIDFAEVLPKIRRKVQRDMAEDSLERDKVIAAVVWLLGTTMIRIGNDEYVKENNSFGLTTLRNKHVKLGKKNITFEFMGKSKVQHSVKISHPRIVKIIKECFELPGYELFQYLDEEGNRHAIDSADVNQYLQDVTKLDITAKDFRTWGATTLAAVTLFEIQNEKGVDKKKKVSIAVKKVAKHLRNTVKVCRSYYIHPIVIESYDKDLLVPHFKDCYMNSPKNFDSLSRQEYATLTLLKKYS